MQKWSIVFKLEGDNLSPIWYKYNNLASIFGTVLCAEQNTFMVSHRQICFLDGKDICVQLRLQKSELIVPIFRLHSTGYVQDKQPSQNLFQLINVKTGSVPCLLLAAASYRHVQHSLYIFIY